MSKLSSLSRLRTAGALLAVGMAVLSSSPAGAQTGTTEPAPVDTAATPAVDLTALPVRARSDACAANAACGSGTGTFADARHITGYSQSVRTTKSSTICAVFGPPSIRIRVYYTDGSFDTGPRRYGNCSGSLVTFPPSSWTSSTRNISYFRVIVNAPRLGGSDDIIGTKACRIPGC